MCGHFSGSARIAKSVTLIDRSVKLDLIGGPESVPILRAHEEDHLPRPPKDTVLSKQEIGERLRAARLAREMTQAELAKAIGAHAPNISAIEHGLRGLTIQQVVKIAKALRVGPEEILGPGKQALGPRHSPSPKLLHRLERIQALPRPKQRTILEILDTYLEKYSA